nr:MAG TPA: hypothetical protein [Caudoviricetes sp.]
MYHHRVASDWQLEKYKLFIKYNYFYGFNHVERYVIFCCAIL